MRTDPDTGCAVYDRNDPLPCCGCPYRGTVPEPSECECECHWAARLIHHPAYS